MCGHAFISRRGVEGYMSSVRTGMSDIFYLIWLFGWLCEDDFFSLTLDVRMASNNRINNDVTYKHSKTKRCVCKCACLLTFRQQLPEALRSHELLFWRAGEDHLGHVVRYNTALTNKEQHLMKLLQCATQSCALVESSKTKPPRSHERFNFALLLLLLFFCFLGVAL